MKLEELLAWGRKSLQQASNHNSYFEIDWMAQALLNVDKNELIKRSKDTLRPEQVLQFKEWVARRQRGEPLQYILGESYFYGRRFFVDHRVLIPRPETELLIDIAKNRMTETKTTPTQNLNVIDLGTGSGCIGVTLSLEFQSLVKLVDISADALEVAQKNAMALMAKIEAVNAEVAELPQRSSWLEHFDLVTANPPYIKDGEPLDEVVRGFEPHRALFGGPQGHEMVVEWAKVAAQLLKNGGVFLSEIGYDQGSVVLENLKSAKVWSVVELFKDLNGHDRIIAATKKE